VTNKPHVSEGRNSVRHRITVQGQYRTGSGGKTDVSIVDLSDTGCRIFAPKVRLYNDQVITLKIRSLGPFDATVVWIDNDLFGICFAQALYGPIFDHIRTQLDSPEWRPDDR
jgi:hypothetical protein